LDSVLAHKIENRQLQGHELRTGVRLLHFLVNSVTVADTVRKERKYGRCGQQRGGRDIKAISAVRYALELSPRGATYGDRERDSEGWSTVLVTALGSWGKPVPRGHTVICRLVTPICNRNPGRGPCTRSWGGESGSDLGVLDCLMNSELGR
jgi:hypothetical protein